MLIYLISNDDDTAGDGACVYKTAFIDIGFIGNSLDMVLSQIHTSQKYVMH